MFRHARLCTERIFVAPVQQLAFTIVKFLALESVTLVALVTNALAVSWATLGAGSNCSAASIVSICAKVDRGANLSVAREAFETTALRLSRRGHSTARSYLGASTVVFKAWIDGLAVADRAIALIAVPAFAIEMPGLGHRTGSQDIALTCFAQVDSCAPSDFGAITLKARHAFTNMAAGASLNTIRLSGAPTMVAGAVVDLLTLSAVSLEASVATTYHLGQVGAHGI